MNNIESAIALLKENGYKVTPPAKTTPIPNGVFRVTICGLKDRFIEGREEEKEAILLDFAEKGYNVEKIEFAKDRFYFQ